MHLASRLITIGALLLVTVGAPWYAPQRGESAVPGTNGKFAVSALDDEPNPMGCSPCNFEIYVMDGDGSNRTRLTYNPAQDFTPVWSPDGSRIVFVSDRDGIEEIYVMNADGTGQTRLTNNSAHDYEPTWSPDGRQLAFTSDLAGGYEIFVMRPDGSGLTRLTTNSWSNYAPAWSPDGTKIAFERDWDGESLNRDVYVMNADGTDIRRLTTHLAQDEDPAWAPDGAKIAFMSERDDYFNWEIYVMNADGSEQTRLTTSTSFDLFPTWSPDGSRIAWRRESVSGSQIYTMDPTGKDLVPVSPAGATDNDPDWQSAPPLQPSLVDSDIDGCSDKREYQTANGSQTSGGRRDPLNLYDYFNPSHDWKNRIDDVLMVIQQYYDDAYLDPPTNSIANPAYNPDTDRTLIGPNAWNLGPGNGLQRVDDVLAQIKQYYHDCG